MRNARRGVPWAERKQSPSVGSGGCLRIAGVCPWLSQTRGIPRDRGSHAPYIHFRYTKVETTAASLGQALTTFVRDVGSDRNPPPVSMPPVVNQSHS